MKPVDTASAHDENTPIGAGHQLTAEDQVGNTRVHVHVVGISNGRSSAPNRSSNQAVSNKYNGSIQDNLEKKLHLFNEQITEDMEQLHQELIDENNYETPASNFTSPSCEFIGQLRDTTTIHIISRSIPKAPLRYGKSKFQGLAIDTCCSNSSTGNIVPRILLLRWYRSKNR